MLQIQIRNLIKPRHTRTRVTVIVLCVCHRASSHIPGLYAKGGDIALLVGFTDTLCLQYGTGTQDFVLATPIWLGSSRISEARSWLVRLGRSWVGLGLG